MKFLRHFTAVVLTVAVIVGLGLLWAHASGGGGTRIGSGRGPAFIHSGPGAAPSRQVLLRLRQIKAGVIRVGPAGDGFQFADTRNLIRTAEIEAALAAVVITVSAARRRRRRTRRTAATKA